MCEHTHFYLTHIWRMFVGTDVAHSLSLLLGIALCEALGFFKFVSLTDNAAAKRLTSRCAFSYNRC